MNAYLFESRFRGWLAAAIASMLFGSTYLVTSRYLPADLPLWGAALRALPAGIALLIVARRLPKGAWWWKAAILGSLNMGGFFLLLYIAAQRLPSSIAVSVGALSPLIIAATAWVLIGEHITRRFVLGAAIGMLGVVLIVGAASQTPDPWGVAAVLGASVLMSLGAVLSKRWNDNTPVLATTAWQLMAGGIELLVVAALIEGSLPPLSGTAFAAFSYISLIATAFAYVCWFTGFRHLPAATVGIIALLNPVTGVMLGVLLASEPLTIIQAAGIGLVLTSIAIGRSRKPGQPKKDLHWSRSEATSATRE
ncbi:EamA family transporter [Rhizobium pusense]|uniref:DMT family transporter n=1 Tax=Agrobacterium TaxID=357 RepID=UPI000DC03F4B|nr:MULTISPECIES: EamA family transporter [Agrobacterium]MDH0117801.1 EamA family transporter [Agrobacterium pusense]RAL97211.1 EamA family transporter [Agrobacterium sp. MS2]